MYELVRSQAAAKSELSHFLRLLFDELERSSLPYAVMRNYEGLPTEKTGNDIDIMVKRQDLHRHRELLVRVAQRAGWNLVQAVDRVPLSVYKLVKAEFRADAFPPVLHLDYFPGNSWYAVQFLSADELLGRREAYGSIHVLDPVGRVLCLVLHHLIWSGSLGKEKYQQDIRVVLSRQCPEFRVHLNAIVGPDLAGRLIVILERTLQGQRISDFRDVQRSLRWAVLRRSLQNAPLRSVLRWSRLAYQELKRFVRPMGLLVAIWAQKGGERTGATISRLMPWLWLLDRRNHAFVGNGFTELMVCPDQGHGEVVRLQYGFDKPQGRRPSYKKVLLRLRTNLSRGRVVIAAAEGNSAEVEPFPRVDTWLLLVDNPNDARVKHKVRELKDKGLNFRVFRDKDGVESAMAWHIADRLRVKNKRNGWL